MGKELYIPTSWEETTRLQFAAIGEILFEASLKKEAVQLIRLKVLEVLTGNRLLSNTSKRAGCTQKVAEYTRFIFKVIVNNDVAAVLSSEFKDALTWCLPEEVQDKQWVKELSGVGNILDPIVDFNFSIGRNLLPEILVDRQSYFGPVFTIDKHGILKTDITAGEYFDALEYLRGLGQTGDISYLANIAGCLYRTDRLKYNTFEAQQRAEIFKESSPKFLKAVWFLILSWQHFFRNHPVFGILFSDSKDENNKIDVGSASLIYSMSKEGYGNIGEVSQMHIDDFFAIQVKNLKDTVEGLRRMKKNDAEISRELKVPITTIIKL